MIIATEETVSNTETADERLAAFAEEFAKINAEFGQKAVDRGTIAKVDDARVEKQSAIIEEALKISANDVHGVLAKMLIWAADAPDVSNRNCLSRYDAVLLSALDDLARLCDQRTAAEHPKSG